jgi:hypothetical protein
LATLDIVHIGHLPSADASRQGKIDAVIVYSVDHGAPSSIIVPDEDATEEKLPKVIAEQLARAAAVTSKQYTI